MLDERLLIGASSRSVSSNRGELAYDVIVDDGINSTNRDAASLIPLGYSLLANLLHHVRPHLTPAQTSRIVRLFSRALHDTSTTIPPSLQITAVKLLVSLVDIAFRSNDPDPQLGRDLLVRILRTLVDKLEALGREVERLMEALAAASKEESSTLSSPPSSSLLGAVLDTQLLLRPIIQGMKTIFWCISSYSHQREKDRFQLMGEEYQLNSISGPREESNEEVTSANLKMTRGERDLVMRFARAGLPCLRIFSINVQDRERAQLQRLEETSFDKSGSIHPNPCTHASSGVVTKKRRINHHREILETFAVSFTSLESYNFRKVIAPNLQSFWLEMSKICNIDGEDVSSSSSNDGFFSHLLLTTGKAVSYEFCEVLMGHLMREDVIGLLGEVEIAERSSPDKKGQPPLEPPQPVLTKRARDLARIFSLALSSLLKYPRNEAAFLPHLGGLVKQCVQRSTESDFGLRGASPYLNLLRSLFRTLSSGKFEQ